MANFVNDKTKRDAENFLKEFDIKDKQIKAALLKIAALSFAAIDQSLEAYNKK